MVFYRVIACAAVAILAVDLGSAKENTFENSVGSIFAARCVTCHNGKNAEGGLSLATAQSALGESDSGQVIVPGEPDDSILLDYISGKNPEMPKEDDPLAEEEVAAIRQWIAAGAKWPDGLTLKAKDTWWSRQPLARSEVPAVPKDQQHRVRTPIDAFVIAKLQAEGMKLSPEADARTMIRRLYYDLIGLPPTPDEMEKWTARLTVGNRSEERLDDQAYAELVDELLASPHYGERWARHWLDVVKYADTCGYDKDKLRPNAWPYRDYVIRSFNEDKPYARFVQEQIAGDALFPGEPDGILGLGFIAAGPWDFIGHVEVPESKIDGKIARNLDRDEMVTNTLNTFCSVTIQCARCHNHKFDPYTQEHYYGLQSVFAAVDRAERPYNIDPAIEQKRIDLASRRDELKKQIAAVDAEVAAAGGKQLAVLQAKVKELSAKTGPAGKRPEYGYHSQIEASADDAKWVVVDLGREVEIRRIALHPCHDEYAGIGAGFGFPARFKLEASHDANFDAPMLLADETAADFPNPGLTPYTVEKPVTARYLRLTATKLALRSNDYIFALSELEAFDADGRNVAAGAIVKSLDSIEAPVRWRRTNLVDGIWPHAADPEAANALAAAQKELQQLEDRIHTPQRVAKRDELTKQLREAEKQISALPKGQMVYAAATDFSPQGQFRPTGGKPRPVHVLHRGNVQQPEQESHPGALPLPDKEEIEFDLPSDHDESERRAALAMWITDREHPLTWRSIVNRVWLYHFGQAIVGSPNDFGRMGRQPTHPELLDWLAVEFRDNGQSFKKLHRLIVTSSVYRQSSEHDKAFAKLDGGNQFLWRMNRRRLTAEEIRDSILSVSGRLNKQMGGPGFYLFELEKTAHSPHYEYHKFDANDPKSHRRSVYRFIVRSQPDPFMTTLDCADSSQSTPKRDETLTALQALSMLNNQFNLVMAEHFGTRLENEADELPAQIERAAQLTLGRSPTEAEQEQFTAYATEHGLANLCRVMFNLSEFVYLD